MSSEAPVAEIETCDGCDDPECESCCDREMRKFLKNTMIIVDDAVDEISEDMWHEFHHGKD